MDIRVDIQKVKSVENIKMINNDGAYVQRGYIGLYYYIFLMVESINLYDIEDVTIFLKNS